MLRGLLPFITPHNERPLQKLEDLLLHVALRTPQNIISPTHARPPQTCPTTTPHQPNDSAQASCACSTPISLYIAATIHNPNKAASHLISIPRRPIDLSVRPPTSSTGLYSSPVRGCETQNQMESIRPLATAKISTHSCGDARRR